MDPTGSFATEPRMLRIRQASSPNHYAKIRKPSCQRARGISYFGTPHCTICELLISARPIPVQVSRPSAGRLDKVRISLIGSDRNPLLMCAQRPLGVWSAMLKFRSSTTVAALLLPPFGQGAELLSEWRVRCHELSLLAVN